MNPNLKQAIDRAIERGSDITFRAVSDSGKPYLFFCLEAPPSPDKRTELFDLTDRSEVVEAARFTFSARRQR